MTINENNGTLATKITSYYFENPEEVAEELKELAFKKLKRDWRYSKKFRKDLTKDDLNVVIFREVVANYEFDYYVEKTKTVSKEVFDGYETKYSSTDGGVWISDRYVQTPGTITSSRTKPVYTTVTEEQKYQVKYSSILSYPRDLKEFSDYGEYDGYYSEDVSDIDFYENFYDYINVENFGEKKFKEGIKETFKYVFDEEYAKKCILEEKYQWTKHSNISSIRIKNVVLEVFESANVLIDDEEPIYISEDVLFADVECDLVKIKNPQLDMVSKELIQFENKCKKQYTIQSWVKYLSLIFVLVTNLCNYFIRQSFGQNYSFIEILFVSVLFLVPFGIFAFFSGRSDLQWLSNGGLKSFEHREEAEKVYKRQLNKFYIWAVIYYVFAMALMIYGIYCELAI